MFKQKSELKNNIFTQVAEKIVSQRENQLSLKRNSNSYGLSPIGMSNFDIHDERFIVVFMEDGNSIK